MPTANLGPVRVNFQGTIYAASRVGDDVTIERYGPGEAQPRPFVRARWEGGQVVGPVPVDAAPVEDMGDLLHRITQALCDLARE
jgi:hypothetical protein